MRAALLAVAMALATTAASPLHAQAPEEEVGPNTVMTEPIFYIARGGPDDLKRLARFARKVGFRIGRTTRPRNGPATMRLKAPAGMTLGDAAGVEEAVHDREFGGVTLEGIPQEPK